ncbi:tropinone reductase homolog At5g06060 [Sorghum bicolor]|uniref:tropinone reductase homolog At5g06060 n=1 Tax=Sorghum bicolor TaxID=4558 RepID=UPI000B4252E5|nr:tropinone reductase homolog At5g06060 [Sorghum bicolor]|eukprot:XP_021307560.1 tropinone reductase homolog At5g06060 [Sorghum bicolor]
MADGRAPAKFGEVKRSVESTKKRKKGLGDFTRWSLQGKTALVTGGTRGIGVPSICRVVEELLALGAAVHTCTFNEAELNERLKDWHARGCRVTGSVCDVSMKEQREHLVRDVACQFGGKLDILVDNAGICIRKSAMEHSAEEYSIVMATNLEPAYHLSLLSHPLLKASGSGSIVFISSIAGVVALFSGPIYGMTKAGMNQLAKNLACEWAKDNIRINSIAPGYISTSLTEGVFSNKELRDNILSRAPLRRAGEPEEISSIVAFLCMPGSTYTATRSGRACCPGSRAGCAAGFEPQAVIREFELARHWDIAVILCVVLAV